jgi:prepilin-type N-terminal cleavage/methylation domain-containing protein
MRRGLTLIEVLVSLALLSAIIAASASWTTVAGHSVTTHIEPSRWQHAAENVLDLIHDDIAVGDFPLLPPEAARSQKVPPKVTIVDGNLVIRTRSTSPTQREAVHRYRLDELTHELQRSTAGPTNATDTRVLLGDVDSFTVQINEQQTRLTVSITSSRVDTVSRSFTLP